MALLLGELGKDFDVTFKVNKEQTSCSLVTSFYLSKKQYGEPCKITFYGKLCGDGD